MRVLGKDHPDTAATLYNLASLFAHKGDRSTAAPMFDRAGCFQTLSLARFVFASDISLALSLRPTWDVRCLTCAFTMVVVVAALIYAASYGPAHPETKDARKKAVLCGVQPAGNAPVATTI